MRRRPHAVRVVAPARLRLGLLDRHGGLPRRVGSLALSVDAFSTPGRVEPAERFEAQGDGRVHDVGQSRLQQIATPRARRCGGGTMGGAGKLRPATDLRSFR